VVIAFMVALALVVSNLARDRAIADAQSRAALVVAVLSLSTDPGAVQRAIAASGDPAANRVGIHGLVPALEGHRHATDEEIRQAANRAAVVEVADGLSYLRPVDIGGARAVVEVYVPNSAMTRGMDDAWYALGAVAVLLMVVSVWASDRLAARVVRSARSLAAAARALGDGAPGIRVPTLGPRELAEASAAFNAMADGVAAMRAAERELIADLSHRLRTPLTALRLEAERVRAVGSERLTLAVDGMEREVDQLIHAARRPVEARSLEPDRCDAAEVVRDRMGFWSAVADDQNRPFRVLGTDLRVPVPLARSELAAALDALLGNVFRYTPQGTPFEVAVSRRDGYVAVRVEDAGAGIDDPHRAVRRGSSDRGSTGLGLDIVRRAAVAGRGTVDVDRGRLGGTSIVVLLADAEPPSTGHRPLRGFVGRLSREPDERHWGRRARAARSGTHS
jgi:signal transduction histidine kinase